MGDTPNEVATGAKPHEFEFPAVTGAPEGIGGTFDDEAPAQVPVDVGAESEADISMELRRILGRFATGVTIVTRLGDQVHGKIGETRSRPSCPAPLVMAAVDARMTRATARVRRAA